MTTALAACVLVLLVIIGLLLKEMCDQNDHIEELKTVNRALREELVELIRAGRLL